MNYSTAGSPATDASAGLVTHCLYSACNCNYGPIVSLYGTATMRNCVFTGNYLGTGVAAAGKGPIAVSGTATLANNVIYGNWASLRTDLGQVCAGIYVESGSPSIFNNIVRNNKINGTLVTGTVCNYYLAGGTPIVRNNNSDEGFGEEAQTGDPLFADPDNASPELRDFSLAAGSPCVDAGVFFSWQNRATDYSGVTPRYQGEGVDIGAYELAAAVTPQKLFISAAGQLGGEKYATAILSVDVAGATLSEDAVCSWYMTDPSVGAPEPFATGNPVTNRFTEGSWTVYAKVANADGAGGTLFASRPVAIVVTPGADYYVSGTGDDAAVGDIDTPFKTMAHAAQVAPAGSKIKIVGTVQETSYSTIVLTNVEVYGESRTTAVWKGLNTSTVPNVSLGENAFLHDVKLQDWRAYNVLNLTADSACVSNCWLDNLHFSTSQNPATLAVKGLITHTLYTSCYCNYGPIVNLGGTATMRNCVFTGNYLGGTYSPDETCRGPISVSGSARLENNTIYGNWAAENGGYQVCAGIYVDGGAPLIFNNIVRNNKINGTLVTGTNCNYYVAAGTPDARNNNSDEGFGESAQTGDPLFTDAANRDFSIGELSPCRNAGGGMSWQKFATDYTGVQPRRQGGCVDIGAYEYPDGILRGLIMIVK